jgi:hypothetical protein
MPEIEQITIVPIPRADEAIRKPIREAKLRANRENGAKHRGPVTEAGKRRSGLNAYRSGIHGQMVCATAEELEVFQTHTSDVLAEYEPIGPPKTSSSPPSPTTCGASPEFGRLRREFSANGFRENIDSIDAGHPEVDASPVAADAFTRQAKEIMLLSVYEGRLTRIMEKQRAELKALQSERKEAREQALNQAGIFVEHAEGKGEEYDPGEDFQLAPAHGGFVFSAAENRRPPRP